MRMLGFADETPLTSAQSSSEVIVHDESSQTLDNTVAATLDAIDEGEVKVVVAPDCICDTDSNTSKPVALSCECEDSSETDLDASETEDEPRPVLLPKSSSIQADVNGKCPCTTHSGTGRREMWMIILDTVLDEIAIRKNILLMCKAESLLDLRKSRDCRPVTPKHIYDIVSDVLTELKSRSTVRLTDSLEVILASRENLVIDSAVSVGPAGQMELNEKLLSSIVSDVLDSFVGPRPKPKCISERLQTVIMNMVLDRMGFRMVLRGEMNASGMFHANRNISTEDKVTMNRITEEVMTKIVRACNGRLTWDAMVMVLTDTTKSIYHNGKQLFNVEYLQQFIDQRLQGSSAHDQRASGKPMGSLYKIRQIKSPFSQTGARFVRQQIAETYINTFDDGSQTYQVIPTPESARRVRWMLLVRTHREHRPCLRYCPTRRPSASNRITQSVVHNYIHKCPLA